MGCHNSSTNANPVCNKNAREVNQAKSKAASSQCYAPRNCHGCVDGENLVICVCISCSSVSKTEREEMNQGVEDSAVNPPDIEDITHCLENIESERREMVSKDSTRGSQAANWDFYIIFFHSSQCCYLSSVIPVRRTIRTVQEHTEAVGTAQLV